MVVRSVWRHQWCSRPAAGLGEEATCDQATAASSGRPPCSCKRPIYAAQPSANRLVRNPSSRFRRLHRRRHRTLESRSQSVTDLGATNGQHRESAADRRLRRRRRRKGRSAGAPSHTYTQVDARTHQPLAHLSSTFISFSISSLAIKRAGQVAGRPVIRAVSSLPNSLPLSWRPTGQMYLSLSLCECDSICGQNTCARRLVCSSIYFSTLLLLIGPISLF